MKRSEKGTLHKKRYQRGGCNWQLFPMVVAPGLSSLSFITGLVTDMTRGQCAYQVFGDLIQACLLHISKLLSGIGITEQEMFIITSKIKARDGEMTICWAKDKPFTTENLSHILKSNSCTPMRSSSKSAFVDKAKDTNLTNASNTVKCIEGASQGRIGGIVWKSHCVILQWIALWRRRH